MWQAAIDALALQEIAKVMLCHVVVLTGDPSAALNTVFLVIVWPAAMLTLPANNRRTAMHFLTDTLRAMLLLCILNLSLWTPEDVLRWRTQGFALPAKTGAAVNFRP